MSPGVAQRRSDQWTCATGRDSGLGPKRHRVRPRLLPLLEKLHVKLLPKALFVVLDGLRAPNCHCVKGRIHRIARFV